MSSMVEDLRSEIVYLQDQLADTRDKLKEAEDKLVEAEIELEYYSGFKISKRRKHDDRWVD